MRINNLDVEKAQAFGEEVKRNPAAAKKVKRVEGEWVIAEGKPQFAAEIDFPAGRERVEADFAPFLGGGGLKPDPVQYCLYGLAACYAGTYAAIATEEGVTLRSLRVAAENEIDLSRAVGLSERPIVERVRITVDVGADASLQRLQALGDKAVQRCPGVYCLTNPIPLSTEVRAAR